MGNTTFSGNVRSESGFQTVSKDSSTGAVTVVSNVGGGIVANAASALTADAATHAGKIVKTDRAAGSTITLPAATGTGAVYRFYTGTAITSGSLIIQVASSSDTMAGRARVSASSFDTTSSSDTVTMNGTTSGGLAGDMVTLTDVGTGKWAVDCQLSGSGTKVTPFSAAV